MLLVELLQDNLCEFALTQRCSAAHLNAWLGCMARHGACVTQAEVNVLMAVNASKVSALT
jgi:hypothetical protein